MATCNKCTKELDTKWHLCQEYYNQYQVAFAEQDVAVEDTEWAG